MKGCQLMKFCTILVSGYGTGAGPVFDPDCHQLNIPGLPSIASPIDYGTSLGSRTPVPLGSILR